MAAFHDCLRSAVEQKELTQEQADALAERYDEYAESMKASGDADPLGNARAALAREYDEAAARKRAIAEGSERARDELSGYAQSYRDRKGNVDIFNAWMNKIENFGFGAGTQSMANLAKAKYGLATEKMADYLSTFRRSAGLGRRINKPLAADIGREVLGEDTGSATAKAMAKAWTEASEDTRQQFNQWAGYEAIGKLEGGYLPQFHDSRAVLTGGLPAWKKKTADERFQGWWDSLRPRLDTDKMRDPLTGGPISEARLGETARVAWEHIATDGWSDRKPSAQPVGIGALATQRSDHRFFQFKSFDDWAAYNKDFGKGDVIEGMFQHLRGITKDTAAMELLGPNPNATVEWMKQALQSEIAKHTTGKDSLYSPRWNQIEKMLPKRIEAAYDYVKGGEVVSGKVAAFFGNIRNMLISTQLGKTAFLAATQDPWIDMAARHLSGIPMTKAVMDAATALSKEKRDVAVRAGLGADDFLHIMGDQARYAGQLGGSEWSRWLPDRLLTWTGLQPFTQSRQHRFGIDFMGAVADHTQHSWDDLNPFLRRTFTDYGMDAKDWEKLRTIDVFRPQEDSAGILRPSDVAQKDRGLAENYLEAILGQTERAVPTGTARTKSLVPGGRGTIFGEIMQSGLQYKAFGLSFTSLQLQALHMEIAAKNYGAAAGALGGLVPRGAAYAGGLWVTLTFAGALAQQIQNVLNLKDVEPMDTLRFWLSAMQKGGGFGVLGDYLFADYSRFGHTVGSTLLGPTYQLGEDILEPVMRQVQKEGRLLAGEEKLKPNPGREAVQFMRRYTPIVSTIPFIDMAYKRIVLDQLQYLVDPEAHKYFRNQEQRLHRETGQGFYWRPGEMTPARPPDIATKH